MNDDKKLFIKFLKDKHICKTINMNNKNIFEILKIRKGIDNRIDHSKYYTDLNFNPF